MKYTEFNKHFLRKKNGCKFSDEDLKGTVVNRACKS